MVSAFPSKKISTNKSLKNGGEFVRMIRVSEYYYDINEDSPQLAFQNQA